MAIADPPAETIAAPSLDALAAAINDDHDAVEHMARSTLDRARAAGDKLLQAKSQVAHGQWLPWLAANCPRLATRTAQAYMKLAREWDRLELKSADSAHLTLDGALKLLAAPADSEADPVDVWLSDLLATCDFPMGSIGWRQAFPPAVLFLDALGWSVSAIAERLGLSVSHVAALLDLQPGERSDLSPGNLPDSLEALAPWFDRAQREYHLHLTAQRAERLMFWYRGAADLARRFHRGDLSERFAGMARVYEREMDKADAKIPEWPERSDGSIYQSDLLLIGAFLAAGCDMQRAIMAEPLEYPEMPVAWFLCESWREYWQPLDAEQGMAA
jgi:hypothetical protein